MLTNDSNATALLRSFARHTERVMISLPVGTTAQVETYDETGRLVKRTSAPADDVVVKVPAGGFAVVHGLRGGRSIEPADVVLTGANHGIGAATPWHWRTLSDGGSSPTWGVGSSAPDTPDDYRGQQGSRPRRAAAITPATGGAIKHEAICSTLHWSTHLFEARASFHWRS